MVTNMTINPYPKLSTHLSSSPLCMACTNRGAIIEAAALCKQCEEFPWRHYCQECFI